MQLYLVQHGASKSDSEDPQRSLTDDGRSRKQTARFQDLLQPPSHAYRTGRANVGSARVTTSSQSALVSMATPRSGPLSDTGGCLISQRLALSAIFGQPRQNFQAIIRSFSSAACFAAPIVSLPPVRPESKTQSTFAARLQVRSTPHTNSPDTGCRSIALCLKRISCGSRIAIASPFYSAEQRISPITWARQSSGRECKRRT